MTNASRQVLPDGLRKASAKILLNPDGSFVASEMPGLFYFPGRRDIRLEAGSGSWKLVSREGRQGIQLDFYAITDWSQNRASLWHAARCLERLVRSQTVLLCG